MLEGQFKKYIETLVSSGVRSYEILSALPVITERPLTLSQCNISSKTYSDWKKNGVVPKHDNGEGRTWVRLNLSDYVWLILVSIFRFQFGVSYDTLRETRRHYYRLFKFEEVKDEIVNESGDTAMKAAKQLAVDVIMEKQSTDSKRGTKQYSRAEIEQIVENMPLDVMLHPLKETPITNLDTIMLVAAKHKFNCRFILIDNVLIPSVPEVALPNEIQSEIDNGNYISISLLRIINELIANKSIPQEDKTKLFGERDLELLDRFRKNQNRFAEKEISLPPDTNIAQALREHPNQDILVVQRDNKRVKVIQTIKKLK